MSNESVLACESSASNLNMTKNWWGDHLHRQCRRAIIQVCFLQGSRLRYWRQTSHISHHKFTTSIIPTQPSLPCRSCGRTRPGRDSWRELCSQRWRCFGQADSEPPTCRSWLAHPGTHVAPGMDASWVGRRIRPAPKALILAWECYSNQTRGRGFLDPEWQILSRPLPQKIKLNRCVACV